MVTPAARREAVALLRERMEVSERRACTMIGTCRMTVRYRSQRPDDGRLRERMKALADERRRFGYRRLHILLRREGYVVNHKRLFRLYKEERLIVRRRGGRKRAMGTGTVGISVCEAVIRHASKKRSLNTTANCVFASNHSRGGRFQSAAA